MADEPVPPEVTEFFRKIGKKYGHLGAEVTNAKLTTKTRKQAGRKAALSMTPTERSERASVAAKARWAKAGAKKAVKKAGKKAGKKK